jgi:flagellar M-ring protein FliF
MEPIPGPGIVEIFTKQSGTLINAFIILVVAVLLILFGLRPVIRAILTRPEGERPPKVPAIAAAAQAPAAVPAEPGIAPPPPEPNLIEDLTTKLQRSPHKRLEQMVEFDEEQAASILKQWLRAEEKA